MTSTSAYPDFSHFFELADPFANQPLRLRLHEDSKSLTNEQAYRLARGQPLDIGGSVRLRGYKGGPPRDFLWTAFPPLVCISQQLVDILTEHGFSGWSTYPVEVSDRKGKDLQGYYGFAVTGPSLDQDRERSSVVLKPPVVAGAKPREVYQGLYFDRAQWDGSDFFWVRGGDVITKPVRDVLKRARVTNVRLLPLEEVEINTYLDTFIRKASDGATTE